MAPAQLGVRPTPEEWSANEVLAHLRACADVWGAGIATMLAEERLTLRAINPAAWIERTDYRDLEFPSSLHAFTSQQGELLAVLKPLSPEAWARAATVTGAGKPLERTVHSYAVRLARHERPHIAQIQRIVDTLRVEQPSPPAPTRRARSRLVSRRRPRPA